MSDKIIRIATRSSKLALWQAEHMKSLIEGGNPGVSVEIVHIKTVGDQDRTSPLRQFGGTGVFTREVQASVLAGDTDIAVHSLKDLQTDPTEGLTLAGIPDREVRMDALLLPDGVQVESIDELKEGAKVGTGSPRRQAQLLHARPDLQMEEIRGNVDTRIRKLDEGEYDAIVLAEAGLRRLGLADRISCLLEPPLMLPAVGQGALGIECRSDDDETREILAQLSNDQVAASVTAERSLLNTLRAGCHAPLGVLTTIEEDELHLEAVILSTNGKQRLSAAASDAPENAAELGKTVAAELQSAGADELIAQD